jgi:hypothetical protein
VFEAAGYDSFFADLLEHHANGGDVMEFISVKTRDWNKASDEEIMRDSLRKTYGDLSDEDFNALYDAEVVSKYALSEGDDFTDAEKRVGKIRLKAEADRLRKERIAEQGNFKLPDASKPVDRAQVIQELEQEQSTQYAEYANQVNGNEVTQRLRNDKRIVIGEGKEAYNYAVDSEKVIGSILDTNKLFEPCLIKDAEGKVAGYNFNKAYKLAAFANDMDAYDKALINHGKSLATNDQIEEAVNPARKDNVPGQPTTKSLAETFATEGRNTTVAAIMGR